MTHKWVSEIGHFLGPALGHVVDHFLGPAIGRVVGHFFGPTHGHVAGPERPQKRPNFF